MPIGPRLFTSPKARSRNMPATVLLQSCTGLAKYGQKHRVRHTGGRISATKPWSCSSATFAATQKITICDGYCPSRPVAKWRPVVPERGVPWTQSIERGYRKTAEIYGSLEGRSLINCRTDAARLWLREPAMPTEILVKDLRQAFDQARELDGSMAERLDVFADAVRTLHPSTAAIVDRLVARLRQHEAGEDAPKPGDVMPTFVLPDETGRLVGLKDLLAQGPAVVTFHRGHWCPYCRSRIRALVKG